MIDIVLADEPPVGWPLTELIELLNRPGQSSDRQVLRLVEALRRVEADLDSSFPNDGLIQRGEQLRAA